LRLTTSAAADGVGAQIRDKIGYRYVRFVADGAHHGDKAGKDCPRHALVVKAPQVFQRAAAAPDD
jgi:hypothetical protein